MSDPIPSTLPDPEYDREVQVVMDHLTSILPRVLHTNQLAEVLATAIDTTTGWLPADRRRLHRLLRHYEQLHNSRVLAIAAAQEAEVEAIAEAEAIVAAHAAAQRARAADRAADAAADAQRRRDAS